MSWIGTDISFEHCLWIAHDGDLFVKIDDDMWCRSSTGYNEPEIQDLEDRIGIPILRDFADPYDTDDWGNEVDWEGRVGAIMAYDNDVSDTSVSWTDDELRVLIGEIDKEFQLLKLSHDREFGQLQQISTDLENSSQFEQLYFDCDWGELGTSAPSLTISTSTSNSDEIVFHADPDDRDLQQSIAIRICQWMTGVTIDDEVHQ